LKPGCGPVSLVFVPVFYLNDNLSAGAAIYYRCPECLAIKAANKRPALSHALAAAFCPSSPDRPERLPRDGGAGYCFVQAGPVAIARQ
jgi:hypothetical protein